LSETSVPWLLSVSNHRVLLEGWDHLLQDPVIAELVWSE